MLKKTQAMLDCQNKSANLLVINNQNEFDYIKSLISPQNRTTLVKLCILMFYLIFLIVTFIESWDYKYIMNQVHLYGNGMMEDY